MEKVYVVQCRCYSGEDSISVWFDEKKAIKCMEDEMAVEIKNLRDEGRSESLCVTRQGDVAGSVYVKDSDIYFDWSIEEAKIYE